MPVYSFVSRLSLSLPLDGDDSPQCGEMSQSDKGDRHPSGGGVRAAKSRANDG